MEVEQGMEGQSKEALTYYITVGTSVRAYKDGKEIALAELQDWIEVKPDGVLGPVTAGKVMDWNSLEIK
jgi:hypothetical protein